MDKSIVLIYLNILVIGSFGEGGPCTRGSDCGKMECCITPIADSHTDSYSLNKQTDTPVERDTRYNAKRGIQPIPERKSDKYIINGGLNLYQLVHGVDPAGNDAVMGICIRRPCKGDACLVSTNLMTEGATRDGMVSACPCECGNECVSAKAQSYIIPPDSIGVCKDIDVVRNKGFHRKPISRAAEQETDDER